MSGDVPARQRINLDVEVDDLIHVNPDTRFKLLHVNQMKAPPRLAQKLALPERERVKRIVRIRMQGDHPLESIVTYVAARIGCKIPDKAFTELALPTILSRHASTDITTVNHTISALLADTGVSSQIEIPVGSPVLMIERDYVARNRIVAVSLGYYRSDLFRYELKLKHRAAPKNGESRNRKERIQRD